LKKKSDYTIYRLDRLGIPLIEIATAPDIHDPITAQKIAEHMGMLYRSTGKAKRGLGTIRQDVNVSIKGGNRVEIKGAQDLKMIPTLIDFEIIRQQKIIEISKNEKLTKKINPKINNITEIFINSTSKIIQNNLKKKKSAILTIKLENFKGHLSKELCPNKRLGSELSDYAKVKAGVGGLFHSDELPKYGITDDDIKKINNILGCKKNDAFILIADEEKRANKAINAVIERINMLKNGVIMEVRNAKPDGTTTFLRPMPGAHRMYPETDVPIINIDKGNIEIPETIDKKIKRLIKEYKLTDDLASKIAKGIYCYLFEKCAKEFKNIKLAFIAENIIAIPAEIRRNTEINIDDYEINEEKFLEIFADLNNNEISKDQILNIFFKLAKGKAYNKKDYKLADAGDIKKEIKEIISQHPGLQAKQLMGIIMGKLGSKASGKLVMEILQKLIK